MALAALAGAFVADQTGIPAYLLPAASTIDVSATDYALYGMLGCACAMVGIGIMRLIASIEGTVKRSPLPLWGRPVVGGLLLIPLAMASPQVLSSGHGALHLDLTTHLPLLWIGALLLLKCLASGISLGFGFRGGLFFASLFMGTLVGALFAGLLAWATGVPVLDPTSAALAGMAALAPAVVGAPMTMAMLVLEGTHDFLLTSVVMSAVLVSSTLVRQWFGYSFSTWGMHLRGETIKSARDVGWVHNLNAGRMMRKGVATTPAELDVASFRQRFPLGSGTRVVLIDSEGHYAGIVQIPRLYADGVAADAPVANYAENRDVALPASADVVSVMERFDQTQADELTVVGIDGQVLGVVSEAFVRKRYAEELDKRQRELMGERAGRRLSRRPAPACSTGPAFPLHPAVAGCR
ncbi:MAG: Voltage-gated ClC-type chloride channel ClcB [Stenotrophomonas maltophilia]|uniref:Voltage-gated ClC-type chloride channel ClcB n=1 Tax=Stenotrophomonas maltophilia TaxID=40324 RepID=A0A7V8JMK6_STEMA|nr:MAG: Voltage-gated ClC-type chloride channel ClcB [Stenotrophomonas maltophilia]